MYDSSEGLELQTVTVSAPAAATQRLIEGYAAALAARRAELVEDRLLYQSRLADLAELDPHDCTGLGKIYRAHVQHIDALLREFDGEAGVA